MILFGDGLIFASLQSLVLTLPQADKHKTKNMGSHLSTIVFQPPEVTYTHARRPLIWLRTKSGSRIPAFHLDNQSKVTVLFSHGNAEDLGMIYEWFVSFSRELRVNVFAYDYEGYGKTTGAPSENACYEDIDAAFTYLVENEQIPPENIILYGRSLGSGPSLYLAERLAKAGGMKPGAVILQVSVESNVFYNHLNDLLCLCRVRLCQYIE